MSFVYSLVAGLAISIGFGVASHFLVQSIIRRNQFMLVAANKIPRHVEFVDEFPMTVTGKLQKLLTPDMVETRLGLKAAKTA
jgi:acyl-CoA synthetase (AMP-forming)/AMP-acid ligase II